MASVHLLGYLFRNQTLNPKPRSASQPHTDNYLWKKGIPQTNTKPHIEYMIVWVFYWKSYSFLPIYTHQQVFFQKVSYIGRSGSCVFAWGRRSTQRAPLGCSRFLIWEFFVYKNRWQGIRCYHSFDNSSSPHQQRRAKLTWTPGSPDVQPPT